MIFRLTRQLASLGLVSIFWPYHGFAQLVTTANARGVRPFESYAGDRENVNLATGNLNIRIPLVSLPGRNGTKLEYAYVYNSKIWDVAWSQDPVSGSITRWWTSDNAASGIENNLPGPYSTSSSDGTLICDRYAVTLPGLTNVSFSGVRTSCQDVYGRYQPGFNRYIGDADGASVMRVQTDGLGTDSVTLEGGMKTTSAPTTGQTVDSNGNIMGGTDTLGRSVTITSTPSSQTLTYTDSSGASKTISFNSVTRTDSPPTFSQPPDATRPTTGSSGSLSIVLPTGRSYVLEYNNYGEVIKITYPAGGYTRYDYQTFVASPAGASAAQDFREVVAKHVCSKAGSDPTINACTSQEEFTTTYSPTITSSQSNNQFVDVRDPYGNRTRHEFSIGGGVLFSLREINRWDYAGESTLLRQVSTEYDQLNLGLPTDRSQPIRITTTLADTNQVSKVEWDYDTYQRMTPSGLLVRPIDNVIEQREYAYGVGAPGPLLRRTVNTWMKVNPINNQDYGTTAIFILNRKASEAIYDGAGTLIAQTQFEYDNYVPDTNHAALQASGAARHDPTFGTNYALRGNMTAIRRWRNTDASWLATYNQYDDAGNVLRTIDPAGNATTFSYADNFTDGINRNAVAYVTQTTLPATGVSHVQRQQYYFNTGLIAASCGENVSGATCSNTASPPQPDFTKYSYDALGRSLSVVRGDGGQTGFTYNESTVPLSMVSTSSITAAQNLINTTVVDGLARAIQAQLNSDTEGVTYVDTTYDPVGRVSTVSNPYRSTTDSTYGITTYKYDALNRVTKVIPPDGTDSANSVLTDYLGNRTTVTDQAGKQRRSFSDALGRLIQVDEPGASPGVPPTSGVGTLNISGALQPIYSNPTRASGSVTIDGTLVIGDTGTVRITVNGVTKSKGYSSFAGGNTAWAIASNLTNQFNIDPNSPVSATVSGVTDNATVTLTALQAGTVGNTYTLAADASFNPAYGPSFTTSISGCGTPPCYLSGATDGTIIGYDSGSVTVTVAGFSARVNYNQSLNNTLDLIVGSLTSALNGSGTTVSAVRSGNSINLTSIATGQASNYSVTTAYTWDQAHFASYSYSVSPNPLGMTGGSDGTPAGTLSLANPFTTLYTYDALNNLGTVVQGGSRQRTFTYDSLSRLICASNPENSSAPCPSTASASYTAGTTGYTYDSNGNVLTKTSPAPNQTGTLTVTATYSYDGLNRLTQKSYSDPTPVIKYGYDGVAPSGCTPPTLAIANGIGRRTGVCDAAGAEAWSYNVVGLPLADRRTTNGVTKDTTYSYNFDGSIATLTYPSGRTITFTLASSGSNTAGRISSAVDSTGPINYATAALYAPTGALSSFTNGASIVSTYFYNSRLQPCRISVKSTGTPPSVCTDAVNIGNVLDFAYNFSVGAANNGNVTAITNNRDTTRSQSFAYDSLNRISTAKTTSTSGTTCWDEAFGYDPWGNLLSIGRISGYTCSNEELLNVNATTKNQISGDTYDAAGNLIIIPAIASYTYDAENHLKTAAGVTYTYDGDGKRVQKSNGKLYWYGMGSDPLDETDLAGNTSNASFNEYIFFGGKRIARRDSTNAVNYYFADHLGTARIVANSSGTVLDDSDFYPFGGERVYLNSSPQNYKFTGKERDPESGLDNFDSRYFGSSAGRFVSPDDGPGQHTGNPQSWNLYSYVENNPLNSIDPTGHSTHTAANGDVLAVYDDGDLGVYQHTDIDNTRDWDGSKLDWNDEGTNYMGETKRWGEFANWNDKHPFGISGSAAPGAFIHFGRTIDGLVDILNSEANRQGLTQTAFQSMHNGDFDIKTQAWADHGSNTGYLLNGEYVTIRSAGNYLAGLNAMTATFAGDHLSPQFAQKLFGAYQQGGRQGLAYTLTTGKNYPGTSAPYWGEQPYSGFMQQEGINAGTQKRQ